MKKSIGLFFGSFNPVHKGHIKICEIIFNHLSLAIDQIWLIPSPHSPFKKKEKLIDFQVRLTLLKLVVKKVDYLKVCPIEFNIPQPNYTYVTLKKIQKKEKEISFSIIMGEDNLSNFYLWKKATWIIKNFSLIVFPRKIELAHLSPNEQWLEKYKKNVFFIQENYLPINSSTIRLILKKKKSTTREKAYLKKSLFSSTIEYFSRDNFLPIKNGKKYC